MSGDFDSGTGTGGYRDTAVVDLRRRPERSAVSMRDTQAVRPSAPVRSAVRPPAESVPAPRPSEQQPAYPLQLSEGLSQIRTVERHLDEILAAVPQPDPIELAVLDAQGLLCAEEVVSARALPAFDQAALDGYAARAEDVVAATFEEPIGLAVVGESVAGARAPCSHGPGRAR